MTDPIKAWLYRVSHPTSSPNAFGSCDYVVNVQYGYDQHKMSDKALAGEALKTLRAWA